MRNAIYTLLFIILVSCNNRSTLIKEIIKIEDSFYTDVPFIQEYHEGFVIDKNTREANDVYAVQPDLNNDIWIAPKNGIYRKKGMYKNGH